MSALFLSGTNVDAVISNFTPDELVALMATVFTQLSLSSYSSSAVEISMPHRAVIPTSAHNVLFMPSRLQPFGTAMKVVSVPRTKAAQEGGLPATTLVMDEETGRVKAFVNAGKLTALRNAAGSLLSARLLIPESTPPQTLVAIGSGAQIAAHISLFLQHYPSIRRCTIFNRSLNTRLESLIHTLQADEKYKHVAFEGHVLPEEEPEGEERRMFQEILKSANVVITATSSTKPLFPSEYISPGTHLCLIGSYTPAMHEVDTELINRAGIVVVDSKESCKIEGGELIAASTPEDHLTEIGSLLSPASSSAGEWTANESLVENVKASGDVTIFKSVGVGIQDVAIASAVVRKAEERGVGTRVQL